MNTTNNNNEMVKNENNVAGAPVYAGGATESGSAGPAGNTPHVVSCKHLGEGVFGHEIIKPWGEAVDGKALLEELAGLVMRFVILPKQMADALALWIVHTYAFELRDVTTYLGVESPEKRCGKTTLLTLLSRLVNRPVVASNISSPAFFRVIEDLRPTLIIDEADTFLRKNGELRGILNSGYARSTAFVVRVANEKIPAPTSKLQKTSKNQTSNFDLTRGTGEHGGHGAENVGALNSELTANKGKDVAELVSPESRRTRTKPVLARYSCWCPKVMAAIGRLPETLADRCIVVRMERKKQQEACDRLKFLTDEKALELQRKCARFVAEHAGEIEERNPLLPSLLNDRAADIWEPLLVIAELAGDEWALRGRKAAELLCVTAQERSPIGALLLDLWLLFMVNEPEGRTKFFTREVLDWLNRFGERPWWALRRKDEITDIWLAQQLRPYGVSPKNVYMNGEQGKGYTFEQLEEVFKRYVPRAEIEARKADFLEDRKEREEEPSNPISNIQMAENEARPVGWRGAGW